MILVLDAGNSRLKWASVAEERFRFGGAIDRDGRPPRELFRALWSELPEPPVRVVVANVAGESFRRSLTAWARRHWAITPEYPRPVAQGFGIVNGYRAPETLGVDRWFALIAAARKVKKGPVCVADCGTALTIDAMDGKRRHLGGLIVPGTGAMRRCLEESTAGIRLDAEAGIEEDAVEPLGRDTRSAVVGGTLYAGVAMVERVVEDLTAELGTRVRLLVTGGEAEWLLPLLRESPVHAPHLVLEGLAWYARRTAQSSDATAEGTGDVEGKELAAEASGEAAARVQA